MVGGSESGLAEARLRWRRGGCGAKALAVAEAGVAMKATGREEMEGQAAGT